MAADAARRPMVRSRRSMTELERRVADLEGQLRDARLAVRELEARTVEARIACDELVDGREVVEELRQLAGVEYPKVVRELIAAQLRSTRLAGERDRAEREASMLAAVVAGNPDNYDWK
jgi:chromosome segregation ATPase